MSKFRGKTGGIFQPGLISNPKDLNRMKIHGHWDIQCFDKDGNLKWEDVIENLVVNAGLNYLLSAGLAGGTQTTTWYLGLLSGTPTLAAGDTMGSHSGWTEITAYSESVRQTWTPGSVASQSVDNSASKGVFSINGSATVGGAFLTSSNTKSGTSGTLFSAGAFSGGNRSLVNTDVLNVQATFTQADDGV